MAANVLIPYQGTLFVQGFYAHRISVFAKSKKVAGAVITVSCRKIFFCFHKKDLRCTKLSFIQLGGGIATGVHQHQKNLYSLTNTPEMWVSRNISLGVRTTTSQVCPQLFTTSGNHPADVEFWERPLRYYYCGFHDLLCEPPTYCLSRADFIYSRWQLSRYDTTIKRTKTILKKIIRLTIETGSLTGK
jgi:hypothetical protein